MTVAAPSLALAWREWVRDETGADVVEATSGHAGGSRELWYLRTAGPGSGAGEALVLRIEGRGGLAGTELTLEREAAVYRALSGTNVPMPALRGCRSGPAALLLQRVPGTASIGRLSLSARDQARRSFFDALGALHAGDVTARIEATIGERTPPVEAELARWRRLAGALPDADPLLAFAFAWLDARRPAEPDRPAFLHGDAGPGNFLTDAQGNVTGLVDWELAHLGDPMDDIAWVDLRSRDLFGDATERDAAYERGSGHPVDAARVRYFAVLVRLRCAVITGLTLQRGGGAAGHVRYLAPHHRFRLDLAQAIALGEDLPLEPAVPSGPEAAEPGLEQDALDALEAVTQPLLVTRDARWAGRTVALTLEAAQRREALGPDVDRAEVEDRSAMFGTARVDEVARRCGAAGAAGDADVLAYLQRHAARALSLWATPSSGIGVDPLTDPRQGPRRWP